MPSTVCRYVLRSPFTVSETADVYGIAVPRYNTQVFGLILSLIVMIVVALVMWTGKPSPPTPLPHGEGRKMWRFWFVLALLSAGMFVIGFFRGDSSIYIANFRADQILDVMFVGMSVLAISLKRSAKE